MSSRFTGSQSEEGWVPPRTAAGIHYPKLPAGLATVDWKTVLRNFITERPEVSLGIALVAGVALGWLIKRR